MLLPVFPVLPFVSIAKRSSSTPKWEDEARLDFFYRRDRELMNQTTLTLTLLQVTVSQLQESNAEPNFNVSL
jgi:hypothetical protein